MTAVAVLLMVVAAAVIGYHVGRRAAVPSPTWRQRTRRSALGRQAIGLITLLAVGELERTMQRRLRGRARLRR
ncbi:hypothetical protein Mycch_4025 [Mycolicibacterium chubuense NBB4]|uniref:Uncharacterized protein n=1 Tax=Mycolicibacterium chubuense (strain NBB4) TaxID=710421 RepID=I4BN91_MYCCN|nr:hypothetical protein [Mycolicibacterium chubuense]AFM18748.1 hypothetical protein Mycch_4025 [Mycolicibacterium chubuense NBB4]